MLGILSSALLTLQRNFGCWAVQMFYARVVMIWVHSIIQIHNNVMWDWHHSTNYFIIKDECGECSAKYYQSHKTLLWIWIMLCCSKVLFVELHKRRGRELSGNFATISQHGYTCTMSGVTLTVSRGQCATVYVYCAPVQWGQDTSTRLEFFHCCKLVIVAYTEQ